MATTTAVYFPLTKIMSNVKAFKFVSCKPKLDEDKKPREDGAHVLRIKWEDIIKVGGIPIVNSKMTLFIDVPSEVEAKSFDIAPEEWQFRFSAFTNNEGKRIVTTWAKPLAKPKPSDFLTEERNRLLADPNAVQALTKSSIGDSLPEGPQKKSVRVSRKAMVA